MGQFKFFRNLRLSNVELTTSLWFYTIYEKNVELIYLNKPNKNLYVKYFAQSNKCHHSDIANYFQNNYLQNEQENSHDAPIISLKYYNFFFILDGSINQSIFFDIVKYDYYILTAFLNDIDMRTVEIMINLFNTIQNHTIY